MASEIHPLDDPLKKARTVRALVIVTPFMFVGCYLLAWIQGAQAIHAAAIAAIGAAGCAIAALAIHLFGSKSRYGLILVGLIAALLQLR